MYAIRSYYELIERRFADLGRIGQDHILYDRQALRFEEHMLGTAQANAFRAVGPGAAGIIRISYNFV